MFDVVSSFGLIWDDLVPFYPRSCLFVLVPVCSSLFRFFVRFNNITLESQPSEESYYEFLFDLYHWITPLNPFRNQGSLSHRPSTSSWWSTWTSPSKSGQKVWKIWTEPFKHMEYDMCMNSRKNTRDMISTHCLLMFISLLNNLR